MHDVTAPRVTADDIVISREAFAYLKVQKGKLHDVSHDFRRWCNEYRASLQRDYDSMRMHLPTIKRGSAECVLDIGSGLGGIDILLNRHYDRELTPILMDGTNDRALMTYHRRTFSNIDVAQRFHADNGCVPVLAVDANARPLTPLQVPVPLVISLGAWCFHIEPEVYLEYVESAVRAGARIIVDIRKDKPRWKETMEAAFNVRAVVHGSDKFDRTVYEAY